MNWENQPLKAVSQKELLSGAKELKKQGYRIVQICCTMIEGKFELTYSFDKDYKFTSMRVTVPLEAEVQSITGVYGGAFLYENEIKELFGVKFTGINIDYNGHFYKKKIDAPFGKNAGVAGK
ncbi:MAG: NADH-quinone oxidoreductase subunit C [Candidatus Aenigmatarchaeota archaeon]